MRHLLLALAVAFLASTTVARANPDGRFRAEVRRQGLLPREREAQLGRHPLST